MLLSFRCPLPPCNSRVLAFLSMFCAVMAVQTQKSGLQKLNTQLYHSIHSVNRYLEVNVHLIFFLCELTSFTDSHLSEKSVPTHLQWSCIHLHTHMFIHFNSIHLWNKSKKIVLWSSHKITENNNPLADGEAIRGCLVAEMKKPAWCIFIFLWNLIKT